jgi:hypothetical protein
VTWSARIQHTPAGLALTFGAPLSRLDMAPDVARHRLAGVVRALAQPVAPTATHALQCDCDACINRDHHA